MVRFGENLKRLRHRADISQKELARRLGFKDAANSNISTLERQSTDVPQPKTIRKYAAALGCEPWELLAGVATEYDLLRSQTPLSDEELAVLLWGLAYVQPPERREAMATMQSFLRAARPPAVPPQVLQFDLGKVETAEQTRRGKKQA